MITSISLPTRKSGPLKAIGIRLAMAVFLIVITALITYVGRDGYKDNYDETVTLLDSFYYATVSITTTGYGDVTPVSERARFITTVVVTPFRIIFLVLLVGTTVEFLASASHQLVRLKIWRRKMSQHVIICGYGTKGQSAAATLKAQGEQHMVIIDTNEQNVAKANNHGYAAIHGNAARANVLKEARIHEAKTVIVAADRDDTAVLITLSARSLNPDIHIAAGVREEENAPLLRQSGANTVLVSSGATGRLLGMSSYSPQVVSLLEDLLDASDGLNIEDRLAAPEDIGPLSALKPKPEEILLALVRNDQVIRRHNYQDASFCIQENDHLIFLKLA